MKPMLMGAALTAALAVVAGPGPAQAKGCITGAVVGGVAGHVVHHGVMGAAAGCAVGHHEASKNAREKQAEQNGEHNQVSHNAPSGDDSTAAPRQQP